MYAPHGNGVDKRGNTVDRYNRKTWMLNTFGNGTTCDCTHCGTSLNRKTLEADRIVPGESYRHENIQPSCRTCNVARSDNVDWKVSLGLLLNSRMVV